MEERIKIVYLSLPLSVKGFVTQTLDDNGESFYTICLNTAFNDEVQFRTFRHEIKHIGERDFDSLLSVNEIERMRHSL